MSSKSLKRVRLLKKLTFVTLNFGKIFLVPSGVFRTKTLNHEFGNSLRPVPNVRSRSKLIKNCKGEFYSEVKLSVVILTAFECSRPKTRHQITCKWHISTFSKSKTMDFNIFKPGKTSVLAKFKKLKIPF